MRKSLCLDVMFSDVAFPDRFARAREAGFDCVEFGDWSGLDITQAQNLLRKNNLVLTSIPGAKNHSLADPDQREDFLEFLSQSIAVAKVFSCTNIVIACESDAGRMAAITRTLADAARKAARAGMTLLVKPDIGDEDRPSGLPSTGDAVKAVNSPALRLLYEARRCDVIDGRVLETLRRRRDLIAYVRIGDDSGDMRCDTCRESLRLLRRALAEYLHYDGVVGFRINTVGREEYCLEEIRNF